MQNTQIKRKDRTVRRKKLHDLLAVLFFLLLLPYVCSVLTTSPQSTAVETVSCKTGSRFVRWEKENGIWRIPEQEFLVGALAASVPGYYREETMKAQAVILRSSILGAGNESTGFSYLDMTARKELWQENFVDFEAKVTRAVQVTEGIVLTYENRIISPPYFRLSAGRTRAAGEIWEDGRFSWCAEVLCQHDLEAEEFLQTTAVNRSDFLKKMRQEGVMLPDTGTRIVLTRDSAGYVLSVKCDGQSMEGERFRTLFGLSSSHFEIREEGENLIFTTKGVGHGLGFDQYAADLLAGAGQDYQTLLYTFFDGVTLEKVE